MKNQNILFCSSFTPPINAGGGRNAYNFGKFLVSKGYNVTLVSPNRKGKLKYKENNEGLIIRRVYYLNYNIFTKIISLVIILPFYFYYVVKNDLVFIYGGNIVAFEFIILFGKLLRKNVVFQSLLLDEDDIETLVKRKFLGKIEQIILPKISLYFSINHTFSNLWLKTVNVQKKLFESVQGVDINKFNPANNIYRKKIRNKLELPPNVTIIISVGYLIKRKGFKDIFRALERLDLPFLYIVVGDYQVTEDHYMRSYNPEMLNLFNFGKNLLGNKFMLTGPKYNINEYLNASDLFILNSEREGTSNAILESMACGLPTIFREIPGIKNSVMKPGENILITTGKPDDILKHIRKIVLDKDLGKNIGGKAVSSIQDNGSFDVVWDRLLNKLNVANE